MIVQIGWFAIGLFGLYFGAEWLVKGSSRWARGMGIKPIGIALTVVAFGTSSPELAVSLLAMFKKSEGMAIGNIIGSNIANIGLILGISAIVSPLKIELKIIRRELPVMIGTQFLLVLLLLDGEISFGDGFILFAGLLGYVGHHLYSAVKMSGRNQEMGFETALKENSSRAWNTLLACLGLTLLIGGAYQIVASGIFIARALGISEVVIGITLVALGTSLPELAISVVSAFRAENDIAVGNVVGSNIFNVLCVIGLVSMVAPLHVDRDLVFFEIPVMLLFSIVLLPFMRTRFVLSRVEGGFLLAAYGVFIAWTFWNG